MATVANIIIKAVVFDQAQGAVGGLQPWIQILQHQRQKNLQKVTEERRETRKHKTGGEIRRTVSNKHFCDVNANRERGGGAGKGKLGASWEVPQQSRPIAAK